jgi:pyruvate/2-oxoglutarate dehydrogenase complex dihydrolipoamide dehydrogenase (E3) component
MVRVLRVPFAENDLAQVERAAAGLVKVVATERGRILGAAAVGRGAGELVALFSLAISAGVGVPALRTLPLPYPSRADIVHRVAVAFDGPGRAPVPRGGFAFLRRSG